MRDETGTKLVETIARLTDELAQAKELLREIRDGEVNPEDEADKFLRDHEPSELSKSKKRIAALEGALIDIASSERGNCTTTGEGHAWCISRAEKALSQTGETA